MRRGVSSICSILANFTMAATFLLPQRKGGKRRKGDSSIGSILANFTMAATFLLPQRRKSEKRGLFNWLHFSRFYYGCHFLIASEGGKMRRGGSLICSIVKSAKIEPIEECPFLIFPFSCGNKKVEAIEAIVKLAKLEQMGEAPFLIFLSLW